MSLTYRTRTLSVENGGLLTFVSRESIISNLVIETALDRNVIEETVLLKYYRNCTYKARVDIDYAEAIQMNE